MSRFMLHVQYIGTHFRGVTRIEPYYYLFDPTTIQGNIELGLKSVKNLNDFKVESTSRTDSGVHALHNIFGVTVQPKNDNRIDPNEIIYSLNRKFAFKNIDLRANSIEPIENDFDIRGNVAFRTYLYRLAVLKNQYKHIGMKNKAIFRPLEEYNRCLYIENDIFDVDRLKQVASMFVGTHDFLSFMKKSKEESTKRARFTTRTIDSFTIESGQPIVFINNQNKASDHYEYIDIRIKSRAFVYQQVRRMIAAMIAVAVHKLTLKDIYEMITIPSQHYWPKFVGTAPAHPLYLCKIEMKSPDETVNTR